MPGFADQMLDRMATFDGGEKDPGDYEQIRQRLGELTAIHHLAPMALAHGGDLLSRAGSSTRRNEPLGESPSSQSASRDELIMSRSTNAPRRPAPRAPSKDPGAAMIDFD